MSEKERKELEAKEEKEKKKKKFLEKLPKEVKEKRNIDDMLKLVSPEELEKMEQNLERAVEFLEKIGIAEMDVLEEKFIIVIPFEYEDFSFLSYTIITPEWIVIKTSVFELKNLPTQMTGPLFSEVLKGNYILNGVVFSLDVEGASIWCEGNIPVNAGFEVFKLNYFAQIMGIDYFMKHISPMLNLNLKSTYKEKEVKESLSRLYV